MQNITVTTVSDADDCRAVGTIVLAFAADPVARWCWPDPHQYLTSMPGFVRGFGGRAFGCDGAHCTTDRSGAALWLAPNIHPDESALGEIIERSVSVSTRGNLFSVLEKMGNYHPQEPHWYLPLIGVDPTYQGKGYGSTLMQYALRQFDRDHVSAYLESSNPRNIPFYRRFGFEPLDEIQVGNSPTITPMVRQAR
jgi:ribosomal protein S18 acetylase RimI-like enzyme